ncbi:MAG TPA: ATP-binding cassette domain-containing protein [Verrucomicrobiota bacterium]|nr:ATP-binding cassette domain-containing protein [Verrucomicrobiota bacterium]
MDEKPIIEVANLTKRFSGRAAINNITFTVARGEVVGLLGPNGAGKTTTMRILSCYLMANSGIARIAGYDVFSQPYEVKRRIGYMPENNPLHKDMRVREYLKFRARIKGLGWRESRKRVDLMIEQCGLSEVSQRIIGQLSKGYQQRVGLADALVHNPELIILDEPTIGLDPNQIRSVRHLIKDLSEKHTILLSTHNLTEVEMTCNRILILAEGKILAADTPDNLQKKISGERQIIAEIMAPISQLKEYLEFNNLVESFDVIPTDGGYMRCMITSKNSADLRQIIYEKAAASGWKLRELTRKRYTLEDIFVKITKKEKEEE